MADEKSCGAIVYTYEKSVRKYVIIRGTGIYKEFCGFPKGHMELGETETETALREVKEETGLDVSILDSKVVLMDYNEAMQSLQYEESRRELTEAEEYLDSQDMPKHKLAKHQQIRGVENLL